jgi:chromate transporter
MTDEEFGDVLALANTLPGPIATKMAGYIGYRKGGWIGLVNAIIATALPTVIIMVGLVGALSAFRQSPIVKGMTEAIAPIIAVMLGTLAYTFFKDSKKSLGWTSTIVLGAASLVLMELLNVHPGILIGVLIAYALTGKEIIQLVSRRGKRSPAAERSKGTTESM